MDVLGRVESKINRKQAVVAVIGLGYVGLPLALEFARRGFKTCGIDVSRERVQKIRSGLSYIGDVSSEDIKEGIRHRQLSVTTRFEVLRRCDCILICVPTPLAKTRQPDLSCVVAAVQRVAHFLRKGQVIVLESTTYPGTTNEYLCPFFESSKGLKAEKDFFLGFSPERVDPANPNFRITDIPKVIGGMGPRSTRLIQALYGHVFGEIVTVSSPKTAEMVKLLENIFRSVNIGLINEIAMVCDTLGIDVWEVIRAAETKPFGFMPFHPGPGIGGHCINVDPMYLAWKARLHGYEPRLVELAQTINDEMPHLIVKRVGRILNDYDKPLKHSRILVLGVAYKKNTQDMRESPSISIMSDLHRAGAVLSYHDPYVAQIRINRRVLRSRKLSSAVLNAQDLILILTDHEGVDYGRIVECKAPIFDTRHVLKEFKAGRGKIFKL